MPAHLGAMHAWYLSGFPPPGYICTSSAGSIVGSVAVQWHEPTFQEVGELIINLRKKQFASLNPKIRNQGILTILATLGMLAPTQKINNYFLRGLATAGATGLALWMQKKFVKDLLFHSESFLVYDNLLNLLTKTFNNGGYDRIFSSKIKIEMLAVNINKAGWMLDDILKDPPLYLTGWKNQGWVSRTNFRPQDVNLNRLTRNRRFTEGVVNSARIWTIFDAGRTDDGDYIVDTAAGSNVPFHAAISEGYDKIVLFYYNRTTEAPTEREFESLLQITFRTNDLLVSENTRKTILGYYRVNNDIKQMERQRRNLSKLEALLSNPDITVPNKQAIAEFITEQEDSCRKLSYIHKKKIKFLVIGSEPLPPVNFSNFNRNKDKNDMLDAINIGAKAFQDARPEIEKLYNDND